MAPEGPPAADPAAPDLRGIQEAFRDVFDRVWAPRRRFTDTSAVRRLFREAVAGAAPAIVQVRVDGRQAALGGVVGPDGWVLTKASVLKDAAAVRCRLVGGVDREARVVGVDRELDLAMLKVEATGLASLDLSPLPREPSRLVSLATSAEASDDADEPDAPSEPDTPDDETTPAESDSPAATDEEPLAAGDWVATVGRGRDPLAVGVVSVLPRPISRRRGYLGIEMDVEKPALKGVLVRRVTPRSAASRAGLAAGDVILAVDGGSTTSPQALKTAIGGHHPGDPIDLTVRRGADELALRAILSGWAPGWFERRAAYQNRLGGELSERRAGFATALQHDTVLRPTDCGGPIVNLDGRVVGFNVARAGRTESYAIPAAAVRKRMADLMSGRLAPKPAPASD